MGHVLRNRGAEIVQTPFVAFLDDDDLLADRFNCLFKKKDTK